MKNMISPLHILLLLHLSFTISLSSPPQSLQLKMIHRDSIRSPLYPGNLTSEELMLRLANHSTVRAQHVELTLSSSPASYNTTRLRPHVFPTPSNLYLVEVYVGTPAHSRSNEIQFLVLDTGSSLVWLQCEPCVNCWSPPRARYNPANSGTFAPIPCNHPLCELNRSDRQCVDNQCQYTHGYDSHAVTKGILATETFGFTTDGRQMEFLRNIVFGCGRHNQNFRLYPQITGFMGFNMMSTSLPTQASNDFRGQFGYCLQKYTENEQTASVLRIGDNAVLRGPNVKTVPFAVPDVSHYFLPLADVSIASRRLGFPPGTFRARKEGNKYRGGFVIDSGTGSTMFVHGGPYERVKQAFIDYFQPFGLTRSSNPKFEVCYKIPSRGFTTYPSMTLHFENGKDLVVQPDDVVWAAPSMFCVVIQRSNSVNIFGTYQQRNYRISYDTRNRVLSYVPADCSADLGHSY